MARTAKTTEDRKPPPKKAGGSAKNPLVKKRARK